MSTLTILGGQPLRGRITIPGAKNAATPILAACLLTSEQCILHNVPHISDVDKMLELLQELGAKVAREGSTVTVQAAEVELARLTPKLVKSMRSSVLLFGPLLARLRQVSLAEPGGCIIGKRPLTAHLEGLRQLGVKIEVADDAYHLSADTLVAGHVVLPEFSVTATENIAMVAAHTPGTTTIDTAAAEPHVQDLCAFLSKLGATVHGSGTHHLVIQGKSVLHGAEHTIIPDSTEAGTWAVLGAVGRGELEIGPVVPEHLDLVLYKLREIGVSYELKQDQLVVHATRQLKAFKLQALPYPGFPTELQAPFAVLATQATGTSLIHDPLYEGRMNHIAELSKMGADALVADPHRVVITGPTPLYGREIRSFDLRAGSTLIIAGLIAQGETVISDIEVVDRGYERLDERLRALGANIQRKP